MTKWWGWVAVGLLACSIGCASQDADGDELEAIAKTDKPKKCKQHKRKDKTHGDCTEVTTTIGLQGGTVTVPNGGPVLTIPFGAVPNNTAITITETDEPAPSGVPGAVGPVFEFQPEGLVFAKPVTVSLPMPAGVTTGQVYWSQLEGPGFDAIGGTIAAGRITTQAVHFSLAVIGSPLGTQTLQGTSVDLWISASRIHAQGTALANQPASMQCGTSTVEAIVDNGMGGFAHVCGSFATDKKTFTVPGVPLGGDYMLHTVSAGGVHTLLVASTDLPDLGRHLGGRPFPTSTSSDPLLAARTALTGVSYLDLTVNNLGGWQEPFDVTGANIGDQVELIGSESEGWFFQMEAFSPPTPGATTPSAQFSLPFQTQQYPFTESLIEGSKGDRTFAAKLERRLSGGGFYYQAMSRLGEVPSFDLVQSGLVSRTVSLAPMLSPQSVSLVVDGKGFADALASDGNPAGDTTCDGLCGGGIGILAQGNDAQFGFYTANADLMLLGPLQNPPATPMNLGTIDYGSASSLQIPCTVDSPVGCVTGTWGELASVRWSTYRRVALPNTTGSGANADFIEGFDWTTTVAKLTGTIGPKLSQPKNVKVDTVDFFTGAASVSATPTIHWDAPDIGTPLFYGIAVRKLSVDNTTLRTVGNPKARVFTADRTFTFPPGILDAGDTYVFTVTAIASTGNAAQASALVASPFKAGLDVAAANVTSAVFGSLTGPTLAPVTVFGGMSFPVGAFVGGSALYWTDRYDQYFEDPLTDSAAGEIWTADLDGNNPHTIAALSGQHAPEAIAADATYIYWANYGTGLDATLQRYTIATGVVDQLDAEDAVRSVVLAPNGDVVYCTDYGAWRIAKDTLGPRIHLSNECSKVAVDATTAYITRYSTGPVSSGKLIKAPLDGSGATDWLTGLANPWDIEVHGGYVYWSNQNAQQPQNSTITRIPLNGNASDIQVLALGPQRMKTFAVDESTGYLYFVLQGTLRRVPIAGGAQQHVAFSFSPCPTDMSAANGRVLWTDACNAETYLVTPP